MSNIRVVSENILAGPRPRSYADLRKEGVGVVVCLQSGAYEELYEDLYEQECAWKFAMVQVHIGCSDLKAPRGHEVAKFLEAVKYAESLGVKLYVHCKHGVDRTGFMIAVYRMKVQNWTYERAEEEWFSNGFHKVPYLFPLKWHKELKKYS